MTIPRRTAIDLSLSALAVAICPAVAQAFSADQALNPQIGDVFVLESDHSRELTLDMLKAGEAPQKVWPKDPKSNTVRDGARFNQVLLLRKSDTDAKTDDAMGVVAFTAICPHAACIVSEWVQQAQRLHCPCHGSEYDPWNKGAVVAGPAPYPLPTLPIQVKDSLIIVSGPFSATPGGHTSRTM